MDDNLIKIKNVISDIGFKLNYDIEKIIIFGSRARGDNNVDSDYDILIIIKNDNISIEKKMDFIKKIKDCLVEYYIASDIIIKTNSEVEYYKNKVGSVIKQALKEGIAI